MKKRIWEAAVAVLLILTLALNAALLFLCIDLKKQNEQLRMDISSIPQQIDSSVQLAVSQIEALQEEQQKITAYSSIEFGPLENGRAAVHVSASLRETSADTSVSISWSDGNNGGTTPASLSPQGFYTADLSIPVTTRNAAISLVCTRDGVDAAEILDGGLSVYSHYLIDWYAYGTLNWSRTSGSQTASLSANVQVSCDAPENNHSVKAMLYLYQNDGLLTSDLLFENAEGVSGDAAYLNTDVTLTDGDSFSLQLVITDSLGYTYTRTLDRLIVENRGSQLTSDPALDRNAEMQVTPPES
ncbi:hypothetical protein [Eisenbergiella sp.]